MNAFDIVAGLNGHWSSSTSRGSARCPAHDDRHASLSVTDGDNGRPVVKCHAGCTQEDVLSALKAQQLWPEAPQLLSPRNGRQSDPLVVKPRSERSPPGEITSVYPYTDEEGTVLFEAVRFEPKDFRQRHQTSSGAWQWNLNGTRRVLYHLPELVRADHKRLVFVVEGEEDADRLAQIGLLATTNPMGAKKWLPDYSSSLRGRHVAILADNDDTGREHAEQVARALLPVAASVRVVELPGLPEHGDVSDWLDGGGDRAALEHLVAATEPLGKLPGAWQSLGELVRRAPDSSVEIVQGLVWAGRVHWWYSTPSAGKTLLCLACGMHIAAGVPFCGRLVESGTVVLFEEDSSLSVLAEYVELLSEIYGFDLDALPFRVNVKQGLRLLTDQGISEAQAWLDELDVKPRLVMFDACERFVPSERFSSAELDPFARFLGRLASAGTAVVVNDHTRKAPTQAGVTLDPIDALYGGRAKSAISDAMLHMSGRISTGARLAFTKFRGQLPAPMDVKFDPALGLEVLSRPPTLSDTERSVMRAVNNRPGDWSTKDELRGITGLQERTLERVIGRLQGLGYVERDEKHQPAQYRAAPGAPTLFVVGGAS